ncbi:alkaline phosphatase D family protein [Actinomadura sp. ATCC 31491]|uniref:Alkaline phosphatase D family protein n=1 Tax=Actinomadura luzonensis TaxID=2805427 RepID=A0ABT0G2U3_9ACTN|nr:alkaline phosphatase D family protein [Actinomadura luzonensis]MCK2218905.1 alkaline phosphatase D family protein [Actinomadura luzonensis]
MDRRAFLTAATAGLLTSQTWAAPASARPSRTLRADPFTLGVASGDPSAGGFVLWTRLAVEPLSGDGRGGMPARDVEVDWQVAADERFSTIVRSGTATARARDAHSVHVELDGLEPGRDYFYRFRSEGRLSPEGRTRTTPTGATTPLTFAVAACAHYEHGYYTAYRRLAEQEPDLVVFLGDYMYEYGPSGYTALAGRVRTHTPGKCRTLADYRLRHAQYKSDHDLQKAHATAPWLVAFDDHEIENNWAGSVSSTGEADFASRRAQAFRAYYENMPLRRGSLQGAVLRVNRRVSWGTLARFHLLDTRQFRDDQACLDGVRAGCDERLADRRTLLGAEQWRWLEDGLRGSTTRWNLLGQQIMVAQRDYKIGPGREVNLDSWDGYAAERTRLLGALSRTPNPVVLTGDAHMHHLAELKPDFDDPDSPVVARELVASSVASDGDGYRDRTWIAEALQENPHFSYIDQRRGYLMGRLTADELSVDFRTLDYISRRGAPARTSHTLTLPAAEGAPGAARAAAAARPVS